MYGELRPGLAAACHPAPGILTMRLSARLGLALAAVLAIAAPSSTTVAEGKCVDGNCWMICEDELNRCLATVDENEIDGDARCFDAYRECGLNCPM
jgi:hypothetical protein